MRNKFILTAISLIINGIFAVSKSQNTEWEWLHQVPNQYQSMQLIATNVIAVSLQAEGDYEVDGLRPAPYQLIDGQGKILHKMIFKEMPSFYYGLMVFADSSADGLKYGLMDTNFQTVLAPTYDYLEPASNGFFVSSIYRFSPDFEDDEYLYINSKGEYLADSLWHKIYHYSENRALVRTSDGVFFIDTNGRRITENFDFGEDFQEGRAAVRKGYFWAYIDENGKTICPFELQRADDFENGLAIACKNGKNGLMDKNGKWAIEPNYLGISSNQNGLYNLGTPHGQYWIMNRKGEKLHPKPYDKWAYLTQNGLLKIAAADGSYQLTDLQKNLLLDSLDFHTTETKEITMVRRKEQAALVDSNGQVIANQWFERLEKPQFGLIPAKSNGKWGIINQQAQWLISPTFDTLTIVDAQTAKVKLADIQGFIRIKSR